MLLNPYFGNYGGQYVAELLIPALNQLEAAFVDAQKDPAFQKELTDLLVNYAGRPTPLTLCRNLTRGTKAKIYLKREDLVHGGAHKTNQVLGQALLAKRMGKTRIIAETGAGQHGVATALVCALLGLKCRVYMGAKDVERQSPMFSVWNSWARKSSPCATAEGRLKKPAMKLSETGPKVLKRRTTCSAPPPVPTPSPQSCVSFRKSSERKPKADSCL